MTNITPESLREQTPGPWRVADEHIVAYDANGGAQGLGPIIQTENPKALEGVAPINVAFIVPIDTHAFEYPVGDSEANARLIAAAPELLAACEAALATLCDKNSELGLLIRAAIKKAKGENHA